MSEPIRTNQAHFSVAVALQRLAAANDKPFITLFEHGSLQVEIYVPRGPNGELVDLQKPHTRDELYVVASGVGFFFNGTMRQPCQTGDLIFVPAGVPHRFEEFTENFSTWVMFYGPEGGEAV
jgi:mannose-6-phosphate isomerase-like protein (cupin superfamily)